MSFVEYGASFQVVGLLYSPSTMNTEKKQQRITIRTKYINVMNMKSGFEILPNPAGLEITAVICRSRWPSKYTFGRSWTTFGRSKCLTILKQQDWPIINWWSSKCYCSFKIDYITKWFLELCRGFWPNFTKW